MADPYPRSLSARERELLWWVLPHDRPGYRAIRERMESMLVIGPGRRGEGNLILAPAGHEPDIASPLPSVVAFGEILSANTKGSVTVREEWDGQIEVELLDPGVEAETGRWTYSDWAPGTRCPQCGGDVRVVPMTTESGGSVTLAICPADRRLWVHVARTGLCRPLPVTLFYSELMRRTGIRDPKLALRSERLFGSLSSFSDDDLATAFISYNHVRMKVGDDDPLRPPVQRRSFLRRWFTFFRPRP